LSGTPVRPLVMTKIKALAARLKPCPFKSHPHTGFFSSL
jgi:hypothetical protein